MIRTRKSATRAAALTLAVVVGPAATLGSASTATSAPADGDPTRDGGKNLVLRPGAIGKAKIGMTIKQAMRTGLFRRTGRCGPLQPKGKLDRQMGTLVRKGHLRGMKITGRNIRTAKGAGLGTTLKSLRETYGDELSKPRKIKKNPEHLWGVFLRRDRRYLGFLLGTRPQAAHPKPGHKVVYMEVTRGKSPTLYPDGC